MNKIREDLTKDFYSLAQIHSTEIKKLLAEYEDEQMELKAYKKEQTQSAKEQNEGEQVIAEIYCLCLCFDVSILYSNFIN